MMKEIETIHVYTRMCAFNADIHARRALASRIPAGDARRSLTRPRPRPPFLPFEPRPAPRASPPAPSSYPPSPSSSARVSPPRRRPRRRSTSRRVAAWTTAAPPPVGNLQATAPPLPPRRPPLPSIASHETISPHTRPSDMNDDARVAKWRHSRARDERREARDRA